MPFNPTDPAVALTPGRKAPYSVSEVQEPAQYVLGQEVTLCCCMEGTFPEDVAVTWELVHGEVGMGIGEDGAGAGPEHQLLLHPLPEHWRTTRERSGTCLVALLIFTPTKQDDGVRVRCVFQHKARQIREQRESQEIRVCGEWPGLQRGPGLEQPPWPGPYLHGGLAGWVDAPAGRGHRGPWAIARGRVQWGQQLLCPDFCPGGAEKDPMQQPGCPAPRSPQLLCRETLWSWPSRPRSLCPALRAHGYSRIVSSLLGILLRRL